MNITQFIQVIVGIAFILIVAIALVTGILELGRKISAWVLGTAKDLDEQSHDETSQDDDPNRGN